MGKKSLLSLIQNYSFAANIVSFIVLVLFLLFGVLLTLFFLQSFFTGFKRVGIMQILFFIIGIYLIYKPAMYIRFLIKNKDKFDEIFNDFIKENKKAIILATILSVVLLSLFYSNIYLNFDFFVNAVLYLPVFLLNNLVFIVNIFLLRYKLTFLTLVMELILPISEILYLFWFSSMISKLFKQKS